MGRRKRKKAGELSPWSHDQVMTRASDLFGERFTDSGAGRYSAEELIEVHKDLRKNPPG
ncbi:MAG: hypothetical protein GF414_08585 [Candidatus Altiarchaeales archaeon]|nr:hypothetical protein [Candidatus Altiarchaeales archaeon]